MTAGKRMGLAFCCILLSTAFLGVIEVLWAAIRQPRMVGPVLSFLVVYLLYALPGWFLALPFVLLFKDAEGRRAWLILIIGTAIGPAFILAWIFLASSGFHLTWKGDGETIVLSFLIAFFTSAFYVLLLRRSARKHLTASVDS